MGWWRGLHHFRMSPAPTDVVGGNDRPCRALRRGRSAASLRARRVLPAETLLDFGAHVLDLLIEPTADLLLGQLLALCHDLIGLLRVGAGRFLSVGEKPLTFVEDAHADQSALPEFPAGGPGCRCPVISAGVDRRSDSFRQQWVETTRRWRSEWSEGKDCQRRSPPVDLAPRGRAARMGTGRSPVPARICTTPTSVSMQRPSEPRSDPDPQVVARCRWVAANRVATHTDAVTMACSLACRCGWAASGPVIGGFRAT